MRRLGLVLLVGVLVTALATLGWSRSVRVTSEDLHRGGGVPPGWTFTMPPGDPAKGKEVFAALECYSCHEVTGAGFPAKATDRSGPDLTRMGAHHPAEYFAESILDPDAVIIDAPGFYDEHGRSTMPSYSDSLTLEEWVNLVAYLKSLTGAPAQVAHAAAPGGAHDHGDPAQAPDDGAHSAHDHHASADDSGAHQAHGAHAPSAAIDGHGIHEPSAARATEHETVAGEYRVRLDYGAPGDGESTGHLRIWVTDAETGHPVPYLPVEARIGEADHPIELAPAIGPDGPHYGAAITIPDAARAIRVSLGPTAVRVVGDAGGKYRSPRQVSFEW
jgi:mono/diheme cytochrome c family protein